MDVKKWRLWQNSRFQQARFLFGSVDKVEEHVLVQDDGIGTLHPFRVVDSNLVDIQGHHSWKTGGPLEKLRLELEGHPEPVFLLSELDNRPLDPLDMLTDKEKEYATDMCEISNEAVNICMSRLPEQKPPSSSSVAMRLLLGEALVLAVMIITVLVRGHG